MRSKQSTSPFRLIAAQSKLIDKNYIESRDYLETLCSILENELQLGNSNIIDDKTTKVKQISRFLTDFLLVSKSMSF